MRAISSEDDVGDYHQRAAGKRLKQAIRDLQNSKQFYVLLDAAEHNPAQNGTAAFAANRLVGSEGAAASVAVHILLRD